MARKIIAGNWKMNLTLKEGEELIKASNAFAEANSIAHVEVVIAPPFLQLRDAVKLASGPRVSIAAQNMNENDNGAFTGEISATMLKEVGVELVIIGHSERREVMGETNDQIHAKLKKALSSNLYAILCVGENLEDRKSGNHFNYVTAQLDSALAGFSADELSSLVIAYEPIWAIGTGETASPEQAQEMHAFIRKHLANIYTATLADEISVLYGGSVKPENAKEIFAQPDVDGGLIGGAATKIDSFIELIKIGESVLR
jgi:triosephosphate isomerase